MDIEGQIRSNGTKNNLVCIYCFFNCLHILDISCVDISTCFLKKGGIFLQQILSIHKMKYFFCIAASLIFGIITFIMGGGIQNILIGIAIASLFSVNWIYFLIKCRSGKVVCISCECDSMEKKPLLSSMLNKEQAVIYRFLVKKTTSVSEVSISEENIQKYLFIQSKKSSFLVGANYEIVFYLKEDGSVDESQILGKKKIGNIG